MPAPPLLALDRLGLVGADLGLLLLLPPVSQVLLLMLLQQP